MRINFAAFTLGGGCIGFYLQDKYERRHKAKLLEEVPALNEKLAQLTARRQDLERALRELEKTS